MMRLFKQACPFGIVEWRCAIRKQREMVRFYGQFLTAGDLVFDVGANYGSRVACFRSMGARVVAFEPQTACVQKLRERFGSDPSVIIEACGIAASVGTMSFHTASDSVLSSFSESFIETTQQAGRFQSANWVSTSDVDVSTLDAQISKYGTPDFIKIDVEGFESEALKGLTHPLKTLSFEWTPERFASLSECVHRCADIGMEYFNISFAESFTLNFPHFVPAEKLITLCDLLSSNVALFGDVYCCRHLPNSSETEHKGNGQPSRL